MAKSHFLQNSFVSGELSPIVKGRTDLDQYYQGLQTATNVVTVPQGGVKRRAGFKFVTTPAPVVAKYSAPTATMPNGGTAANLNDNDLTTFGTTTAGIGTTNPFVVASYQFTSQQTIAYIDLINIKLTTADATSNEFVIQYQQTGGAWITVANVPTLTDFEQTLRVTILNSSVPTPFLDQDWRLARVGTTDLGTCNVSLAEMHFYNVTGAFSNQIKMHKFEISISSSYLLLFTNNNLRIYQVANDIPTFKQDVATDIGTNFPNRVASNENVLLMFNENVPVKRLIYNLNGNNIFKFDDAPFLNVPQFDFNDSSSPSPTNYVTTMTLANFTKGDRFQVDIESVISKNITYTGNTTSTAFNIQKNLQEMPIFGDTGVAVSGSNDVFTITVSGESTKSFQVWTGFPTSDLDGNNNEVTFAITTQGSPRKEDVWSATRGYPKNGVFAGGRLWFGGTRDKPQSVFASKAGSFLDFYLEEGDDDEAIFVSINGSQSDIVDIVGDRGLQIFTEGAEYKVTGNTPTTINIQQQTQHGSFSVNVPTTALDGAILFVDRNGRSLRQYLYDYNEDAYRSIDLSVLASHLIVSPVDMDIVTSTTSEDANYVFVINQDGTAVVLNTLRDQDINGYTKFNQVRDSGGADLFKQCVTVNNTLFTYSQRDINRFTIDQMTFDYKMDSSVKYTTPHSTTLSGLLHLAGDTVEVVAGNSSLPSRAVSATGTITLTSIEAALTDVIEVGQNFNCEIRGMPLNTRSPNGSQTVLNQKRIDRMNLRVYNSAGVYIDGNLVPVRTFGDAGNSPLNSSLIPSTGIIEDNHGGNGWDREVTPIITIPDPTPFHLQAIGYEISS
jgi:hypothetical protein